MRTIALLFGITLLLPRTAAAQPAYSVDSARAAVIAELRARYPTQSRVRFAPDSASMWRDYVVCSPPTQPVGCEFRDSLRVQVVEVELRPPHVAVVEIKSYSTIRGRCPIFKPSAPPQIAMLGTWLFTFRYQDGTWVRVDEGVRSQC